MWNPLKKIKDKVSEKVAQKAAEQMAKKAVGGDGMPDLKELEKQGMLGKFFRKWKDPAFLKQIKMLQGLMETDGVDVKDQKAVQAWLEKNKDALQKGKIPAPADGKKQETFVKSEPEIGRNEPCKCGSGKKYKKCCLKS